jgi:thiol-disulfide isomerase/thioredoxin
MLCPTPTKGYMNLAQSISFVFSVLLLHLAVPSVARGDMASPATQPGNLDVLVINGSTQQPLPEALVTVYSSTNDDQKLKVGADGHVNVPVSQDNSFGFFEVSVQARDYAGKLLEWDAKDKDPIPSHYTIALERGAKIGGRIVDDVGRPVAGAHIVLWLGRQQSAKPHERNFIDAGDIVSAADGDWSFDEAPADFHSIEMGCWDYDYANGDSFPMKDLTPVQLHGGTETYELRRGVPVLGTVRDAAGKPLAGAEVLTGAQMCSNRVPSQKTGADGEFHYMAKPGDEVTLTITRDGYAPELKQFLMGSEKHEMDFQLSKSKPMIGCVVGPKGEPIPFAWVYPDTWRGNRSLEVQIRADGDGKFEWKDAPADTVYCDVDGSSSGYLRETHVPLTVSDRKITVTLRRALSVTGAVVDAQTNKPIDSFNVIHGISFGSERAISWERHPETTTKGRAGAFQYNLTWSYPGYAVRIEASGYQPAESRVFTADEGSVALEFKLAKGADVMATVLTLGGKAAAGATAVLALGGQPAYLYNCREVRDQGCQQATTGPDGKFSFPPQIGPFKLVVFSADGYAETDQDALSNSSSIKLQAWGRIEGTLKIGNKPGVDEQIVVLPMESPYDPKQPRVYHQIETKSDASGKFAFDRVPPGKQISVSREVMQPTGGGGFFGTYTGTQKLDVAPGQSAEVALGGMGRPVIGHVVIPPELAAQNWVFGMSCRIMTKMVIPPIPAMPDEIKNGTIEQQRAWRMGFLGSDAGKAYLAATQKAREQYRAYPLQISQDGAFHTDDVPAGTYTLTVDIARKPGDSTSGSGESIADGGAEFTVPEMPGGRSDEPLEIPTVSMQLIRTLNVGDSAPDFSVKTLAANNLKLSDLHGKYVLLDFWATWCGPCLEEIPSIKAVYQSFGSDPRFVMISISMDEKSEDARSYTDKNGMGWNQAYQAGQWQAPMVQAYCVRSIPSIWLIGPDGRIIAKNLRGDAIKAAVANALGG